MTPSTAKRLFDILTNCELMAQLHNADRVLPLLPVPEAEIDRARAVMTEEIELCLETATNELGGLAKEGQ